MRQIVAVLKAPELNGGDLTYTVKILQGEMPAKVGVLGVHGRYRHADDAVSFAGVARRSYRRAVIRSGCTGSACDEPPSSRAPTYPRDRAPVDFSLVLGGPLFQFWRRARLTDDAGSLGAPAHGGRGASCLVSPASAVRRRRPGAGRGIDLRFFATSNCSPPAVALPLLIVSELVVHQARARGRETVLDDGLIPDQRPAQQFDLAVASALGACEFGGADSFPRIAVVYGIGILVVWRKD